MRKIILSLLALAVVLIGAWALARVPSQTTVVVPELQDAGRKFGYIVGYDEANGLPSIFFDEAEWFNDVTAPNGFRIENPSSNVTHLILANDLAVTMLAPPNYNEPADMNFQEGRAEFLSNVEVHGQSPYWLTFNESGLVSAVEEQYVP